ncbi:MAG: YcaQ family DNA glycosylase [Anaerolineae bacterium]|nr:YcaQ family DNA glycosylase [Anaerolineae bacterium]
MTVRTISTETARRLAITRQRLSQNGKPAAKPSAESLFGIVRDLGCLQLDPISAVARSHLLVLWSRAGVYNPKLVDDLLFKERRLFEYWAHEASIVLTEDYPLHHHHMRHYVQDDHGWSQRVRAWIVENQPLYDHILRHLREHGAALSRQLQADGLDPEGWVSSGWTSGRNVSRMLDFMWIRGEIMVAGRVGGQKQWDLSERVLPHWTPREALDDRETTRRAAQVAIRALGAARDAHITRHFIRRRYPHLAEVLKALHAEGQIVPVQVESQAGTWYVHADDLPLLEQIERGEWVGRTVLLSPFDNLICDRARTKALFNFDYTMEIYVPPAKRKYGYYVLPILHHDRLVGRADLQTDRKAGALKVNTLYAEPGAPKSAAKPLRAALESLASFVGAERLEFVTPRPAVWAKL